MQQSISFFSSYLQVLEFVVLCRYIKERKPGKYFSTSSGVFNLFVLLYIFSVELVHTPSYQSLNLLNASANVALI